MLGVAASEKGLYVAFYALQRAPAIPLSRFGLQEEIASTVLLLFVAYALIEHGIDPDALGS